MRPIIPAVLNALAALSVVACGTDTVSNTTSTTPTTTTATGYLIDSPVAGLTYTSGKYSGTTGSDGAFIYETGTTITFNLGGIVIGTADGSQLLSPLNLQGETTVGTKTTNLVRLLMAIDSDGDPTNGINISSAVRSAAANWGPVNFASATLDSDIAPILSDVQNADSRTPTLPTALVAQNHLAQSALCAYSGGFSGSFSGDLAGTLMFTLDPLTGKIDGKATDNKTFAFNFAGSGIALDQANPTFTTVGAITQVGITVTAQGQLTSFSSISGTWSDNTGKGGTITATRIGPDNGHVAYRTGGFIYANTVSIGNGYFDMVILDDDTTVTGKGYVEGTGGPFTISGSIDSNGTLWASCTLGSGCLISGNYDRANGYLSGTWALTYNGVGMDGFYTGSGCRLR